MFPFMPMLIGAAGGLLTNRKDPLKGALLGAGLGAAGGAIAPSLGGLFGTPAAGATTLGVLDPAQAAAIAAEKGTSVAAAFPASQPGLFDTVKDGFKTASEYAKPIGDAGMAAQQVSGLFGEDQKQAPQLYQSPGDGGSLAAIANADQQGLLALQEQDMKRRQQQMAMIQQMMGRNYG